MRRRPGKHITRVDKTKTPGGGPGVFADVCGASMRGGNAGQSNARNSDNGRRFQGLRPLRATAYRDRPSRRTAHRMSRMQLLARHQRGIYCGAVCRRLGGTARLRVQWSESASIDDETWEAIEALMRDSGSSLQELSEEAFADLLKKHKQPVGLMASLKESEAGRRRLLPRTSNRQQFRRV